MISVYKNLNYEYTQKHLLLKILLDLYHKFSSSKHVAGRRLTTVFQVYLILEFNNIFYKNTFTFIKIVQKLTKKP